jgi:Flp pilus assembly pilin Flp
VKVRGLEMQALIAEVLLVPAALYPQVGMPVVQGRSRAIQRSRAFGADQRGAMAVEFAMILFPLCVLIFFVLEAALVYWISSALDNGLDASMRQFYVQAGASTQTLSDGIRAELCRQVTPLVKCENLKVDIAAYDSFGRIDKASPVDGATGTWRVGFGDLHGCLTKGSVVVVQAALAQQTFQNFGIVTNQFKDGSRLILATSVLQLDGNSTGSTGC